VDGPDAVLATLADLQPATIISALYTAIFASLVGYGIWNRLLARYPSSAVVPFTLLVPVVGMSAAWLALQEVPTPAELAGGLLLLGGVATAVLTGGAARRQRRDVLAPPGLAALGAGFRTGEAADDGRLGAAAGSRPGAREPDVL
jgi:O-acetylserine/cysteine efflux transporter